MAVFLQYIIAGGYGLIAVAGALTLPVLVPTLSPMLVYGLSAGLFVVSLQLHLGFILKHQVGKLKRQLAKVESQTKANQTVLKTTEKELTKLGSDEGAAAQHQKLLSELKVLQTLLAQVVGKKRGAGKSDPNKGAAGKFPAGTDGADANLSQADDDEIYGIIQNALEENRIDLYLQPIVTLPQRHIQHYEAYSRVRDSAGNIIFPRQYLKLAEESGLVGTLDNLILYRCIQVIRKLGDRKPGVRLFCNISTTSLRDDDFFPQFVDYMLSNPSLASRLVFEFSQASLASITDEVARSLSRLGLRGYQFSLDQVTDLDLDLAGLAERHFKFIKVPAAVLLEADLELSVQNVVYECYRRGLELVAEKIEDERTVVELLDYNVHYGQGYLLGEPRHSPTADDAEQEFPQPNAATR